jgi:hypothetical protein
MKYVPWYLENLNMTQICVLGAMAKKGERIDRLGEGGSV